MANKTIKQITTEITSVARDDWLLVQRDTDNVNGKVRSSNLLLNLQNFASQTTFDHVYSGGVWTADSVGVNRNASMTAIGVYIGGIPATIAAVTARTFTASKDTYIDVLSAANGTATLVYTEVANNAASPALAANSIRIGIIVTGATTIATTGSINQGERDKILPIASSIPYATTDSLGNLICPRDSNRKLLGMRQLITTQATASQSPTYVQMTGVSVPFLAPANRKVKATLFVPLGQKDSTPSQWTISIWDGTVNSGTRKNLANDVLNSTTVNRSMTCLAPPEILSAGLHTYNGGLASDPGGPNTVTITGAATAPVFLMVELD